MYLRDTKFLISCAARTGSTFLIHLLRSNPSILAHGEVLNVDAVGALMGAYGRKRRECNGYELALHEGMMQFPERFIQACIYDTQGSDVVGFKYKTDEAFDPRYRAFTDVLIGDTDIKVVHLRRRDFFAQYVSHQVVLNQTAVTLVHENAELPEIRPFHCDPMHAVSYIRDVVEREQRALDVYRDHRSIQVDYEDLIDEDSRQRAQVQEFLGVPVRPLSSTTRKIVKDSRALVANAAETVAALRAAGFVDRVGPGSAAPKEAR